MEKVRPRVLWYRGCKSFLIDLMAGYRCPWNLLASWYRFPLLSNSMSDLQSRRVSFRAIDKIEVLAPCRFLGNSATPRIRNLKVAFSSGLINRPYLRLNGNWSRIYIVTWNGSDISIKLILSVCKWVIYRLTHIQWCFSISFA